MRQFPRLISATFLAICILICCVFFSTGCNKTTSTDSVLTTNDTILNSPIASPPNESTPFIKNTYRTLHTMGTMYDVLMRSSGDLYREAMITDEHRDKIISLGQVYYGSYRSLVAAYKLYYQVQTEENKIQLMAILVQTMLSYNNIIEYYNSITTGIEGVQTWTKM